MLSTCSAVCLGAPGQLPISGPEFGLLYGVKKVVRTYLASANLGEYRAHRPCQTFEFAQGFGISLRLNLPEVSSMLVLFPSSGGGVGQRLWTDQDIKLDRVNPTMQITYALFVWEF